MTYIPKQTKLTKERVELKIESALAQRLERYCEYLESDRDYVMSKALEIAFRKDKGFIEWLAGKREPDPVLGQPSQASQRKRGAASAPSLANGPLA